MQHYAQVDICSGLHTHNYILEVCNSKTAIGQLIKGTPRHEMQTHILMHNVEKYPSEVNPSPTQVRQIRLIDGELNQICRELDTGKTSQT